MNINLNDATTLQSIAKHAMLDNRVVGLVGNKILADIFGGKAVGTGNAQRIWVNGGIKHAVGTGDVKKAFVKSKCKGDKRSGKILKEGDAFVHLSVNMNNNSVDVKKYSRSEIEAMV